MAIITPPFRVSFANVFEPRYNELSKRNEFSLDAIFEDGADLTQLKQAAKAALIKKFGQDESKWPKNLRMPFKKKADRIRKGTDQRYEGYEGDGVYVTLKSKERPQIVGPDKSELFDSSEFYSGCWARASVTCYAYDQAGNRGVNFGLSNLQKLKDDEPFGSRTTAAMDFEPVEGATSSGEDTGLDMFN